MTPIEQLTPAELELIRIKREEDKLAAEKKALQLKAMEEKEIEQSKKRMSVELADAICLVKATTELASDLKSSDYTLHVDNKIQNYKCGQYVSDRDREGRTDLDDSGYLIYWRDSQELPVATIKHISGATIYPHFFMKDRVRTVRFKIHSLPHYKTYGSSNREKTDNLSSAKTINEKIVYAYNRFKSDKEALESKLAGLDWAFSQVKTIHPNATVTQEQYSGTRYGNSYTEGSKFIRAEFANKLVLEYSFKLKEGVHELVCLAYRTNQMSAAAQEAIINLAMTLA